MIEAIPRHLESNDWITIVILVILTLLAWARMGFSEDFLIFQRGFLSDKFLIEIRKSDGSYGLFDSLLFLVHTGLVSLGLYFLILGLGYSEDNSYLLFIKIFVVYTVFVLVKYLIEKILGSLFELESFVDKYIFYKVSYKNFLSLFLLPLLLVLAFLWPGNYLFFKTISIVFLIVNLLGLSFFYRKEQALISSNLFYFILYLCAFEIAPYYILFRIIT